MHPADKTPAPAPKRRAGKSYKTESKSQESTTITNRNIASEELARVYLLYLASPTEDRLNEVMGHCLKFLEKRVLYWVRCRGFCPSWLAPSTFEQDAFDRACTKFWAGIHALRSPQLLERWAKKIAFSAVVEELRKVKGRLKKGPCYFGPLEIEHPDGTVTHVLDRAGNRDAALRYGCCVTVEQTDVLKQLVYREILGKLFGAIENGSKRQREGATWLKSMLTDDLTAEEIAAQRGTTEAEVLSLLRSARVKLRKIAETQCNFTAEDL